MARPRRFKRSGSELLTFRGASIGASVLDFWRWSASDLISNAIRGTLAEFIVGSALGVDLSEARSEWTGWDLTAPNGLRVEVKSAAYVQTWHRSKLSRISFSIRKARYWDPETNVLIGEPIRSSDVYVFCLHGHEDPETIDPLALEQWSFWSVATSAIDGYTRSQHSITLPSLARLVSCCPRAAAGPLSYPELAAAVLRHPRKTSQAYGCFTNCIDKKRTTVR